MVYQAGNMLLQKKQELHCGKVNEVVVCQDLLAEGKTYYLLMIIKDHEIAKKFVEIYAKAKAEDTYIDAFSWRDYFLVVFPYVKERSIDQFYTSDVRSLEECEELGRNIVVKCMSEGIPIPIMYLQFCQRQLHMSKDRSVYMGYRLDLTELDDTITEDICADSCSKFLCELLDRFSNVKTISFNLLSKKNEHNAYQSFREIYVDLKASSTPMKKETILDQLKAFYERNQDKIFRILLVICVVAGIIAAICILTQVIWGDLPFIRILINTFKVIGTESLNQ